MEQYSCYAGIDSKYFDLFEHLWDTYYRYLPEVVFSLQNERSMKAFILNFWINYYLNEEIIIFKLEKTMLVSLFSGIVNKLQNYIPEEIEEEVQEQKQSETFIFIYVYHLSKCIMQHLEDFVQSHSFFENYQVRHPCIYLMNDDDFERGDQVYIVLKILNAEFLHMHLTQNHCSEIHTMSMYFTKRFIAQYFSKACSIR